MGHHCSLLDLICVKANTAALLCACLQALISSNWPVALQLHPLTTARTLGSLNKVSFLLDCTWTACKDSLQQAVKAQPAAPGMVFSS